jgi:hypothetical protein
MNGIGINRASHREQVGLIRRTSRGSSPPCATIRKATELETGAAPQADVAGFDSLALY